MGKTKTVVVSGAPEGKKTGKAAYEEKRKRMEAEKRPKGKAAREKAQVTGVGLKGGERIKVVGAELPPEPIESETLKGEKPASAEASARRRKPRVRGKKYKDARKKIDKSKTYSIKDAIKLVKETSYSRFDGTMELHMKVKSTGLSTNVALPYSSGKTKKVEVADDKTIEKLKKGKIDFDVLLATADMMPKLVPFAKLLGPKGLMPNPKTGTLIKTKADAKKFSGNSVVVKTEKKQPIIHCVVGKVSQKNQEISENTDAVLEAVGKKQIEKAYLSPTMGPSVKIKLS